MQHSNTLLKLDNKCSLVVFEVISVGKVGAGRVHGALMRLRVPKDFLFESQRKRPLFSFYWHCIAIVITPKCFIYCINFLCLNLILNSTLRGHIILVLFEVVVLLNNTTTDIVVLFEGGIIRRSGTIRRYPLYRVTCLFLI